MKTVSKLVRTLIAASAVVIASVPAACSQPEPESAEEAADTAIPVDAAALAPDAQEAAEDTVAAPETAAEASAKPADKVAKRAAAKPVKQATSPKPPETKANDEQLVIKRILPIEGPIKYGEWYWDEDGVPPGTLVITVDLEARVLSVFRGGYEIGTSAVLLGTNEHPTPLGTFPILSKERHNVSEKYDNAPMPWTLRLTRDGIAIHGGSEIVNGYASHGCIAVPDPLAAKLFAAAKRGDKVVITRGKMIGMGDPII